MSDAGSRCSANVGPAGISSRTWQAPFRLSDLTCHSVSLALRSGRPGASSGGEPSRRCLSPTISPVASLVSEETSHGCSGASQKCLTGKGWFGWRPRTVPTQREPSPGRQPVSARIPPCHPVVLGPLWMRDCDLHRAAVHTGKEGVWKTPPRHWPGWERTRSVLAVTAGGPRGRTACPPRPRHSWLSWQPRPAYPASGLSTGPEDRGRREVRRAGIHGNLPGPQLGCVRGKTN